MIPILKVISLISALFYVIKRMFIFFDYVFKEKVKQSVHPVIEECDQKRHLQKYNYYRAVNKEQMLYSKVYLLKILSMKKKCECDKRSNS